MNREDLKNYRYTQEWINGRIEYLEQYKTNINRLNSVLSDMPKGSSKVQDNEAEKLAILIDSINDLFEKVNEVNKRQMQILQQLDKIKQPYKNILDKYYVQGKSLVVIAAEMDYNYEHIKRLHGIALNIFDKMEWCYQMLLNATMKSAIIVSWDNIDVERINKKLVFSTFFDNICKIDHI